MVATPRLSWAEVVARRLDRHALAAPSQDAGPADVAGKICGAHAQVLSAAELSIAMRLAAATRVDVRHALWVEHSLIKTYGPRGTVHLLPAADLAMWTGALSAIPTWLSPYPEGVALSAEQTDEIVEAIATALSDDELTSDELTEALVAAVGSWAGERSVEAFQDHLPRWFPALRDAAKRGAMCYGPNRGRRVTYTSPLRWMPGFRPADEYTALVHIVSRYLHAYGPATSNHFAQWLGAPRSWAQEVFDSLAEELQQVEIDGAPAVVVTGDIAAPSSPPQGVRLLPYFDAYAVGSHPRELVFPGRASERALSRGQAGNFPVLLVAGTVAGVWHQRRSGRKIEVTVEPFGKLTAEQRRSLDDQVERVGAILEGRPELTIGAVAVGGHA